MGHPGQIGRELFFIADVEALRLSIQNRQEAEGQTRIPSRYPSPSQATATARNPHFLTVIQRPQVAGMNPQSTVTEWVSNNYKFAFGGKQLRYPQVYQCANPGQGRVVEIRFSG